MMAANAKVYGLTAAARNEAEFQALGFEVFNPLTSVRSRRARTDSLQCACITLIGCEVLKG
jgi:hypothetical protein